MEDLNDPFPLFHLTDLNFEVLESSVNLLPSSHLALAAFSSDWDDNLTLTKKVTKVWRQRRERFRKEIGNTLIGRFAADENKLDQWPRFELIDLSWTLSESELNELTSAQLAAVQFHPDTTPDLVSAAEDLFYKRRERDFALGLELPEFLPVSSKPTVATVPVVPPPPVVVTPQVVEQKSIPSPQIPSTSRLPPPSLSSSTRVPLASSLSSKTDNLKSKPVTVREEGSAYIPPKSTTSEISNHRSDQNSRKVEDSTSVNQNVSSNSLTGRRARDLSPDYRRDTDSRNIYHGKGDIREEGVGRRNKVMEEEHAEREKFRRRDLERFKQDQTNGAGRQEGDRNGGKESREKMDQGKKEEESRRISRSSPGPYLTLSPEGVLPPEAEDLLYGVIILGFPINTRLDDIKRVLLSSNPTPPAAFKTSLSQVRLHMVFAAYTEREDAYNIISKLKSVRYKGSALQPDQVHSSRGSDGNIKRSGFWRWKNCSERFCENWIRSRSTPSSSTSHSTNSSGTAHSSYRPSSATSASTSASTPSKSIRALSPPPSKSSSLLTQNGKEMKLDDIVPHEVMQTCTQLFISNMPLSMTTQDFRDFFDFLGGITGMVMGRASEKHSNRSGWLIFDSEASFANGWDTLTGRRFPPMRVALYLERASGIKAYRGVTWGDMTKSFRRLHSLSGVTPKLSPPPPPAPTASSIMIPSTSNPDTRPNTPSRLPSAPSLAPQSGLRNIHPSRLALIPTEKHANNSSTKGQNTGPVIPGAPSGPRALMNTQEITSNEFLNLERALKTLHQAEKYPSIPSRRQELIDLTHSPGPEKEMSELMDSSEEIDGCEIEPKELQETMREYEGIREFNPVKVEGGVKVANIRKTLIQRASAVIQNNLASRGLLSSSSVTESAEINGMDIDSASTVAQASALGSGKLSAPPNKRPLAFEILEDEDLERLAQGNNIENTSIIASINGVVTTDTNNVIDRPSSAKKLRLSTPPSASPLSFLIKGIHPVSRESLPSEVSIISSNHTQMEAERQVPKEGEVGFAVVGKLATVESEEGKEKFGTQSS